MDFGGGSESSSAVTRPPRMVPRTFRKLRLQTPSPSASSDGTDANSHEDHEDNAVVSESEEGEAFDDVSSESSLETRYLKSWSESPSVRSPDQMRLAAWERWNPHASPDCEPVDSSIHPVKYENCSPELQARPSVENGEQSSPSEGLSGHDRPSNIVTDEPIDIGDEDSMLHAVYTVVLVNGGDGMSQRDIVLSLRRQSRSTTLAEVNECLKNHLFMQVHGLYVLRKDYRDIPYSFTQKEMASQSNVESGTCGKPKAVQEKIGEDSELLERTKQCALMDLSTGNEALWQCPHMAMKDYSLCEHHFKETIDGQKSAKGKAKAYQGS